MVSLQGGGPYSNVMAEAPVEFCSLYISFIVETNFATLMTPIYST
uniref:Uncharacterized protein n=1 Tax=Trichuris muris TaxID=70415 RepID=A0A5S6QAR6_TRIMR